MVDTLSVLGKPGGGSNAYLTNKEVRRDLSSASFDAGSSISDIGKTVILYSSTRGKSYKMPNANATGMAVGKGTGFLIDKDSEPIFILNQGVLDTNPVLECLALPGADFALTTRSISTAVGDWHAKGTGLFHGPVPCSLPATIDTGVDLGSAVQAPVPSVGSLRQNYSLSKFPTVQTYAIAVIPTAGTSVVAYAASYNSATDAFTWGSAVTVFSSANAWSMGGIIGLDASHYACFAWEATAGTAGLRGGSIAGTVITQGTGLTSGAWTGVNPSNISSATVSSLVLDNGGPNFFHASKYDGTHLGILHGSISGNNVAVDGGSTFASSQFTGITSNMVGGYSPSTKAIVLGVTPDASQGITKYTYSPTVTQVTTTLKVARANLNLSGSNTLLPFDATTGRLWSSYDAGGGGPLLITATDVNLSALTEVVPLVGLPNHDAISTGTDSSKFLPLDASTLLAWHEIASTYEHWFTLLNVNDLRRRLQTNATGQTVFTRYISCMAGYSTNGLLLGTHYDSTTRRFCVLFARQSSGEVNLRQLALQMFNIPRNFDKATAQ